ncbi:hypothetical protein [Clostridium manihotivorum]|uniref:Uncharacterized protein n=1 Tax=Clostridium manihotivorum TaxID=2320868 RepID=A0A3R5R0G3_9CLOT|nr:hypothetical protein [Clostridium manihotivorum]QAA33759.1 hypothetical protein C1I91_20185 [Clostridium manihotivorum]
MYYLNSGYYNTEWGSFINTDDVGILEADGELLGNNLLVYRMNNHVNHSDDDGIWKLPTWAKVSVGVVAIGVCVTATVADVPALIGALQVAGSSTAINSGIGKRNKKKVEFSFGIKEINLGYVNE